jgi:hypothetical protein
MALAGCPPAATPTVPADSITIDGNPSDWSGIAPLITDPAGNGSPDVPLDVVALYVTNDDTHVYFLVELADNPDPDIYDYWFFHLRLDTDRDTQTGCYGMDVQVSLNAGKAGPGSSFPADVRDC